MHRSTGRADPPRRVVKASPATLGRFDEALSLLVLDAEGVAIRRDGLEANGPGWWQQRQPPGGAYMLDPSRQNGIGGWPPKGMTTSHGNMIMVLLNPSC